MSVFSNKMLTLILHDCDAFPFMVPCKFISTAPRFSGILHSSTRLLHLLLLPLSPSLFLFLHHQIPISSINSVTSNFKFNILANSSLSTANMPAAQTQQPQGVQQMTVEQPVCAILNSKALSQMQLKSQY